MYEIIHVFISTVRTYGLNEIERTVEVERMNLLNVQFNTVDFKAGKSEIIYIFK